jgi:hypothetical protein
MIFDLNNKCWRTLPQVIGFAAANFALWVGLTFMISLLFGNWLLYGVFVLLFLTVPNSIGHLIIRLKCKSKFKLASFIGYLLVLHTMIIIAGIFVEKDPLIWVFELTQQTGPLYGIIILEYLVLDWTFGKVYEVFGNV